jgi:glycosyltransferase involved in cell wall biosynthesis
MGSVSQIGWEWYSRLARRTQVTLVTHVRNRAALEAAGAPIAGSRIVWIDTEWFAGPLYRLAARVFPRSQHATFLVSSIDWFVFDFAARRALNEAARTHDVVHRVTPVTPWAPTRLASLGLPVVIGPLNGGLPAAPGFSEVADADGQWLRHLRPLLRALDGLFGSTRRAARILSATRATRASIPAAAQSRVTPMIENGVDPERFAPSPWPAAPTPDAPLRVLFVGRLVPVKAVGLLLQAISRLRASHPVQLEVVGDGPLLPALRREADELGLADAVQFRGALDAQGVAQSLRDAHLLCLPSVRESGGAVLLEAMACGRPVVALNFGGPAEIVDDQVGAAIDAGSPQQLVERLAATLRDVIDEPAAWRARAQAAGVRARERFSWDAKVSQALALYREVAAVECA